MMNDRYREWCYRQWCEQARQPLPKVMLVSNPEIGLAQDWSEVEIFRHLNAHDADIPPLNEDK